MAEPEPPVPTFNAMLICDTAIREEGSRKVSLIGIFDSITGSTFPMVHPALCVYVNLGDAEGTYRLRLELVRADEMVTLGRGGAELSARDRMMPAEAVFQLRGLLFERPGRYEFVLYVNEAFVGRKSFVVVLKSTIRSGESP